MTALSRIECPAPRADRGALRDWSLVSVLVRHRRRPVIRICAPASTGPGELRLDRLSYLSRREKRSRKHGRNRLGMTR